MKAVLVLDDFTEFEDGSFVQLVIWKVPRPVRGSRHLYKYRLAFVVEEKCLLRYDNEAGKGDHAHFGDREEPNEFTTIERLLADFYDAVGRRRNELGDSRDRGWNL